MTGNQNEELFMPSASVRSDRILYTPSSFAKANLLYLQEAGILTAAAPHVNRREKLYSCLCFLVLEGRGKLMYEGQTYFLEQGDVVFIDCRKPYSHSTGEQEKELWILRWCHFYGASLPFIYEKYRERGGRPVIRPESAKVYDELLKDLYVTASSDDYIRDMRINEKLSMLLTCLMGESWHPGEHREGYARKRDIRQVKNYLDENYHQKITLESAAELFYINKHYLARLFKEQYGITFTAYLQQVRITYAKRMLRFTDKKIEEIGRECGVGELAYFGRVFKKIEGISPGEYRKIW
ncbi:MAG: AraC family transcriptional regulator [Lachnospiraceae bacterium]|jgi:AraC-like DNA-binding protein/mannose-6-phosphate isomerase-like protein (cupin superfamily)|nr:AraC family transcriptional regulator [Lachnospiraceae bacterium]